MRYPRPVGITYLPADVAHPIARMSALESMARSLMAGTIPLVALDALGSKSAVSWAFVIGSAFALFVTLNVSRIEHWLSRRWMLTVALLLVFGSALLMAFGPAWSIPLAIGLRSAEAAMFSVAVSLYVMEFIEKNSLAKAESTRMFYVASAWLIGPAAGTWLFSSAGSDVPFLLAMAAAVAAICYHWYLRLEQHNPVLLYPNRQIVGPLRTIPRFFKQTNLRIAYAITCIRSIYWSALFVYGPLYVVEAGFPKWVAGLFLSGSSGILLLSPAVLWWSRRSGTKRVIMVAFGVLTLGLAGLAAIGEAKPVGLVFWTIATVGAGVIDVLGNIPFMRLVKPRERTEMTAIFTTWREVSFLVAPAVALMVLKVGPFWLLYGVLALIMAGGVVAASYLPNRI